jgi:hypothetical protein
MHNYGKKAIHVYACREHKEDKLKLALFLPIKGVNEYLISFLIVTNMYELITYGQDISTALD